MRTSRRILLMALVLLLVLLVALEATAGGKARPTRYSYLTMGFEGPYGLATSCSDARYMDDDGAIKMQRGPGPTGTRYIAAQGYGESEWPILQVEAAVAWERAYPLPNGLTGDSLTGCHGVFDPDGPEGTASVPSSPLLIIDTDRDGKPVSLAWHFDRYAEPSKRGPRMFETLDLISEEGFTCSGGNPYSCSGTFTFQTVVPGNVTGDHPTVHGHPYFQFSIQFTSP